MVRFMYLSLYFRRKHHVMNWNFGGRYSLSRLSESKTNRATARNQGNVGHLAGNMSTVPTAYAGFVLYEALRFIYIYIYI
jgi:hypothetical protein